MVQTTLVCEAGVRPNFMKMVPDIREQQSVKHSIKPDLTHAGHHCDQVMRLTVVRHGEH